MSDFDIDGAIVSVVARVLGVSREEALSARRGEHDGWTSLKHIEIVFQVEEELDMQFDEESIADLVDTESIRAAVEDFRGR